jgi:replicative DNA helicase
MTIARIGGDAVGEGAAADRVPPHDLLSEQSVLGGMLLNKDAVAAVVEEVQAGDFYLPKHELIFDAILMLYSAGEPTDVIAVTDALTKAGTLTRAGGAEYLHTLTGIVPTAANAGYYAKIVQEKAMLRRLVEVGTHIAQLGYASEGQVDSLVNQAQAEVYAVTAPQQSEDVKPLSAAVESAVEEIEAARGVDGEMTGVPTGFTDLDTLTNGLHSGQLIIVAARPGLGKSTLALDFSRNAAIACSLPTIIFSLEMGRTEIAMRLLSAESGIKLQSLRRGMLDSTDWTNIAATRGRINDAPLYIDDSPNLTLVEIRAKCRRLKQQLGLKLIVIDYLQLMSSGHQVESRQQEVSEFSRSLKLLAKELDVPVVALSQLNRGPEQRQDKKPALSDLRESGSLEQDADVVILLHRESSYNPGADLGEAQMIIAKHRNGPTGTIDLAFQGHLSRFHNMAHVFDDEPPE